MVIHSIIMVLGVFIASVAQVLLKKSSQITYDNKLKEYVNWRVLLGYTIMLMATFCTIYAYRTIPISLGMLLDSTGYIFITFFGYMFFKESVTSRRMLALILIIFGIFIYALMG